MQFEPQEEKDIRAKMVLAAGDYDFEVAEAKDTTSKAGNDMIALKLRVFTPEGTTRQVSDWLLPSMELKLNRFCHATGLQDLYFAGAIDAVACEGAAGRVKLSIQEQEGYGIQNSVKDYLPAKTATEPQEEAPAKAEKPMRAAPKKTTTQLVTSTAPDEDIPF